MTTRSTTLGINGNSSGGGIDSNPSRSSSNLNVTTRVAPISSLGMNLNSFEPWQRSSTCDDTSNNFVEAPRGSTNSHASEARNSAPKKTRGFSRAIKTSTIMLTSGKRIEIQLDEDLGVPTGQVRNISSLLSHECGYQVRNHAPLLQAHWDDIDEDTKQKLIDGVTKRSEINSINRSKKRWDHCGGSRPFSLYYNDHIEAGSQFPDIDTWGTTHMSKRKRIRSMMQQRTHMMR
ncbi:uncharacterized protein M6B38_288900 [Iris pallida]|uniref:Uncharacterized protein n=1 Tax=Iris pallida TaxID=29817 RepID=A0AAX6HWM5_IRIPA|nr:uncharacterized protein M6B38_288900 [Iris pallida]